MNAERAAGPAGPSKKIKLKKLMRELKDEDPDAWLRRQAASPRAGGPAGHTLQYKIDYTIEGDIPINPDWIRGRLQASVSKLQKEINKKNTFGRHTISLQAPERVGPPNKVKGSKLQGWQLPSSRIL